MNYLSDPNISECMEKLRNLHHTYIIMKGKNSAGNCRYVINFSRAARVFCITPCVSAIRETIPYRLLVTHVSTVGISSRNEVNVLEYAGVGVPQHPSTSACGLRRPRRRMLDDDEVLGKRVVGDFNSCETRLGSPQRRTAADLSFCIPE